MNLESKKKGKPFNQNGIKQPQTKLTNKYHQSLPPPYKKKKLTFRSSKSTNIIQTQDAREQTIKQE